jgi:hypothetical protein
VATEHQFLFCLQETPEFSEQQASNEDVAKCGCDMRKNSVFYVIPLCVTQNLGVMRGGRAAKKNEILTVYECVQRVGKTSRSCASFFIDTAFISFRIITTESL